MIELRVGDIVRWPDGAGRGELRQISANRDYLGDAIMGATFVARPFDPVRIKDLIEDFAQRVGKVTWNETVLGEASPMDDANLADSRSRLYALLGIEEES